MHPSAPMKKKAYNFVKKKKKKSQYGTKQQKNSKTYQEYKLQQRMVEMDPINPADDNSIDDAMSTVVEAAVSMTPPVAKAPTKRLDDNWRESRAVQSVVNKLHVEKRKRVENNKRADEKLNQEKKKRVAAEKKLLAMKQKTTEEQAQLKLELANEQRKREGAEKKVCVNDEIACIAIVRGLTSTFSPYICSFCRRGKPFNVPSIQSTNHSRIRRPPEWFCTVHRRMRWMHLRRPK